MLDLNILGETKSIANMLIIHAADNRKWQNKIWFL